MQQGNPTGPTYLQLQPAAIWRLQAITSLTSSLEEYEEAKAPGLEPKGIPSAFGGKMGEHLPQGDGFKGFVIFTPI